MEIKIRPAVFADLDTILEIINHQILHSTSIYDYEPRDFETHKLWFEDKVTHDLPVLVAETENGTIGYATYGNFRHKIGYRFTVEHSVYVADQFLGKGIGKLLLAELIQVAKKQKYHTMIGVIDSENEGSIAFHKKYGFETVGVIKESGYKFDRWLSSVFMQLILE
ncbi:phosphinothricin acetyltransferase [Flavobacterium fryxellicola]|uniref:Phosphinothricin acetyltransferase n=1 Tax=Flavobacterium fryxellicola TaxID=249352 RepID=A0A167YHM4_9FLAO|nr:GNAT family N-acetyltransferase [Flavobacterium fryxellicola]OAB29424.1 phosphinothricin acetyltransferase [Flavobacterium fryxellicola]SHN70843.1 phosphinothricin acetyltransferase [Flavobacterium fryxellicola]